MRSDITSSIDRTLTPFNTQAATMAVLTPSFQCDMFTVTSLISRLPQTNVSLTKSVSLVLQLSTSTLASVLEPSCARSALSVLDNVMDALPKFPASFLTNEVHLRLIQDLEAASFAVCRLTTPTLSPGEVLSMNLSVTSYSVTRATSLAALATSPLPFLNGARIVFPSSFASDVNAGLATPVDVHVQSLSSDALHSRSLLSPVTPIFAFFIGAHGDASPLAIRQLAEDVSIVLQVHREVRRPVLCAPRIHPCEYAGYLCPCLL
jgi:hypothetical protein